MANNYCDRAGFFAGLAAILLAASPSMAATNEVQGIEFDKRSEKLELKLQNEANTSFFSVREGNTIKANLLNVELDLPEGNFSQKNPLPGIQAVEVHRIDTEHTEITITGERDIDLENILQQQGKNLVLNLQKEGKFNLARAIEKVKETYNSKLGSKKTKDDNKKDKVEKEHTFEQPDVLIPDPEITIKDRNGNKIDNLQAQSRSRSNLPRAVAPPVGDMAVSNINASPDLIDLNSRALVPRMVLRDAPIREVLSLLARSAGLNVVFATGDKGAESGGEGANEDGPTISLDLENQPVQEVFNSVLLVSGLDANRKGNILYIGEKLPAQARNLVSRTLRLNQVKAEDAALYLASQGAKGKRLTTDIEETVDPETGKVVQRVETNPQLSDLDGGSENKDGTTALLLEGLQISTDGRLNSITLIGEPRKVEMATAFVTQLDARRRQVAVNVKVIDVNLLNQDVLNSSFSFGVDDTKFLQDQGSAAINFGGDNPTLSETFSRRPRGNETTIFEALPDGQIREITIPTPSELPDKFLALLESKITSGNAKILTDPTLTVQEGQQATVRLVQKIVESVKTDIDTESGARTITPEIGEAGLVLTVNVEGIDDNGFVSLSVSPSISSVGATQSFNSGGAVNTLNLLSIREISSGLVRLRDGQTLILSGIIQDQERVSISKVPILGDIPLLGSLFRSSDKTNERAEVVVLLTPEIVDEQSNFGYSYTPGKESREVLKREGVGLPGNPQ